MGRKQDKQNYLKIQKHHRAIGVPWTDSSFPANDSSIGLQKVRELGRVDWRRISDISSRPRLVIDGVGRHDMCQGKLGNCWFVAAASVLAGVTKLWERVVVDHLDQEWDYDRPENYSGVFKFMFWRFGKWEQVLVDDLIPTKDGSPVFTFSKDDNEWWGALLEKAYAKIHGSYEALDGGNLSDALVDFTGGVSELISLESDSGVKLFDEDNKRSDLFHLLSGQISQHALVCCAIRAARGEELQRTEWGLVKGHAYGVTGVRRVSLSESGLSGLVSRIKGRDKVCLVRLRNPWGQVTSNSDIKPDQRLYSARNLTLLLTRSPEWRSVSTKDREKLGLVSEDDKEFWMPWDDFIHQFTDISITHLINTSLFSFSATWWQYQSMSQWSRPGTAGGCLNHAATFLDNPQYRFDVTSDNTEIILQLSQMDLNSSVLASEKVKYVIGLHLLKVENNREYRLHTMKPEFDLGVGDYIKSNHVFLRKSLSPGRYLLLPTTFQPGQETRYLLRMFSDHTLPGGLQCLDQNCPPDPWCFMCGCGSRPVFVTRLTVISGHDLVKQDIIGEADPYVFVKCEGKSVKSEAVKNNQNPEWKFSVIFYRYKPKKGIKIQIWNRKLIIDQFMGQCVLTDFFNPIGSHQTDRFEKTMDLYTKGKKLEEKMGGFVKIFVESTSDWKSF